MCLTVRTSKYGHVRGVQIYRCTQCNHRFQRARRTRTHWIHHLWEQYVFHKQTVSELAVTYHHDPRTIRYALDRYRAPAKAHHPRPVHLLVDATYWGERIEGSSWCVLVARDADRHENLTWLFADTETTSGYRQLRDTLDVLGYRICSVTGDGFPGILTAFAGIPYQMCHVHMERLVTTRTTRKPQTEAGQVLLALARSLHTTNSHQFHIRHRAYVERYRDLLNAKTAHPVTGEWDWTHRPLRQATASLQHFEHYLFTFEHDHSIPKTTNGLEGFFSHLKQYLGIHRGVERAQAQRILHSLLLASSVAPDEQARQNIL